MFFYFSVLNISENDNHLEMTKRPCVSKIRNAKAYLFIQLLQKKNLLLFSLWTIRIFEAVQKAGIQ